MEPRPYGRTDTPDRFAHPAERAFAGLLERLGVRWQYEPRTFVLERDEARRVRVACTPDFYLPELDTYVEITAMRPAHTGRKRRKLRLLVERHPHLRVRLLGRRDLQRLGRRYGVPLLGEGPPTDRA